MSEHESLQEEQAGPSGGSNQIEEVFSRFKSYIDGRLETFAERSLNTHSNEQDSGPDAEAKVFKRETEASKLKFKGNSKQFLFNSKLEDHCMSATEILSQGDLEGTKKTIENIIQQIQKRQKLIKLADKSEAGWLVVEEYEQEELAEDSDDEKRIRKAQAQALKKRKQNLQTKSTKRPRFDRPHDHANDDRQLFRGKRFRVNPAFFAYSRACSAITSYPKCNQFVGSFYFIKSVRVKRKIFFMRMNAMKEYENKFSFVRTTIVCGYAM